MFITRLYNIVRQAELNDADRITELYAQLVNDPAVEVEQEQILALSNDERTMLYVCEYNGHVMGSALLSLCSDVMFRKQPFADGEKQLNSVGKRTDLSFS